MAVRFTHEHSSSRWDRPPATLEQAAREYAERAQSLSVTEVERLKRRQALIRGLGPDWDTYAGSRNGNGDDTAAGERHGGRRPGRGQLRRTSAAPGL